MDDPDLISEAQQLAADVERRTSELAIRLLAKKELDLAGRIMLRANELASHLRRTYQPRPAADRAD